MPEIDALLLFGIIYGLASDSLSLLSCMFGFIKMVFDEAVVLALFDFQKVETPAIAV